MILRAYEEFTKINSDMVKYLNEIITKNFEYVEDKEVIYKLESSLKIVEQLKYKSDEIKGEMIDINKLNNLRYSIMNFLFLTSDLIHFYNLKEYERFKMRALNYINHNSKQQVLY